MYQDRPTIDKDLKNLYIIPTYDPPLLLPL